MGLRQVPPNSPKPSDLPPNIPGQPSQTLGDVLKGFMPQHSPAQNSSAPMSMGDIFGQQAPNQSFQQPAPQPTPQFEQKPGPTQISPEDSADKIMADLASKDYSVFMKEAQRQVASEKVQDIFKDLPMGAESIMSDLPMGDEPPPEDALKRVAVDPMTSIIAGLPRSATGRLDALEKRFGRGNVKYDGEVFTIQTPKGPRVFGEKAFDLADAIYNNPGPVVEGVTGGLMASGLNMAAEGLAGGEIGGLPGFGVGLAASAAGAGFGAFAHDLLVQKAMGVQEAEDVSIKSDMLWAMGIDATFYAGFGLLGGTGKWLKNRFDAAYLSSAEARATKAGLYRVAVDQATLKLKLPNLSRVEGVLKVSPEKTAESVLGAVETVSDNLESQVSMVKDKAIAQAANNQLTFKPELTLKKLREIVGDTVVELPDGRLTMKPKSVAEQLVGRDYLEQTLGEGAAQDLSGLQPSQKLNQQIFGGNPRGPQELKQMVDLYNNMLSASKSGGTTLSQQFNVLGVLKEKRNFDIENDVGDKIRAYWGQLYNAAATDRNAMMQRALQGTPEAQSFRGYLKNFSDKIDTITEVKKVFQTYGQTKDAMDALLTPGNPKGLNQIIDIIGKDSPEFKNIQSYWISERLNEAIDPARPVFDGDKFINAISEKKWGKDTLQTLFPQAGMLNEYKVVAKEASRLQTSDLWKEKTNLLDKVVSALTLGFAFPTIAVRNLWNFTRVNPDLAYFLSEKGLAEMASREVFAGTAAQIRQGTDTFRAMVNMSREIHTNAFYGAMRKMQKVAGSAPVSRVLVPITRKGFQAAFRGDPTDYAGLLQDQVSQSPAGPGIDETAKGSEPVYSGE